MSQLNGISAVLKAYPALLGGKNVHIVSCTNRTDMSSRKNLAHIKNGETGLESRKRAKDSYSKRRCSCSCYVSNWRDVSQGYLLRKNTRGY